MWKLQVTLFHFEDELRKNAAAVVDTLKVLCGLRVLMLTGDNPRTAERVAKLVKIEEFHAGLKPEDKLSRVQRLTQEKGKVQTTIFYKLSLDYFIQLLTNSLPQ